MSISIFHLFLKRTTLALLCMGLISPAHSNPLSIFIEEVLEHNPAIQAAQSNVLAAESRGRASSRPIYNPELTAEKQRALENTESIGINQTIDWTNKKGARHQVGIANLLLAEAQFINSKQELIAKILNALAKYQFEQKTVALAKERTSLLRQLMTLTKKRHESGDIARVDLDLAQLAFSEALAQQAKSEINLNQALQILRSVTGINNANWPCLPFGLPTPQKINDVELDDLMNTLPSVLILNHQYQISCARIKLAEKERYPDPTIGVQKGRSSGDGEKKKLTGITFSMPLFVRNTYRAEVDAANYDTIESEKKYADIVRQARVEIQSNKERYNTFFHAVREWDQLSEKPLKDGVILIERLWQAGEMNTTDYLVQLKQRIESQIAGAELKGQAWEAWVEWLKASGQVESWLKLNSLQPGDQLCEQEN